MVEIKVFTVIDKGCIWAEMFGLESPFSAEAMTKVFEDNPSEKDFKLNIHCPGGSVPEGLAIYDILRTSGKNIFCNIVGDCHSMAVTLLLSAPLENRTANANCSALIHKPRMDSSYGTSKDFQQGAEELQRCEDAILDIYADRTKLDRERLSEIMNEEKFHNAQTLIDWGFISKINTYTNNYSRKKTNTMSKEKTNLLKKITNFLGAIANEGVTNFEFLDSDGNVLFTTEKDDDSLAVGDPATPDGTFKVDGKTIVIADGVITEITEIASDGSEDLKAENEALKAENATLKAGTATMGSLLKEAENMLKKNTSSNFIPARRVANVRVPQEEKPATLSKQAYAEGYNKRKKQ